MSDQRLKIAVFIDFDNVEIGVKTTLGRQFDVGAVLEAVKERGEIITKIAYGDWKRAGDHSRLMAQHAVRLVQRVMTPGGDKNGADINLALDALEMAFTHDHINAFVIVGGDSDFITLVEKLKQYDKKVFVIGGRAFTSQVMQKNCTEFIAYENIAHGTGSASPEARHRTPVRTDRPGVRAPQGASSLDQALPLVQRALKVLADREVSPQLGLLKSTLLQLDSSFSERDYGASTFRDFAEKLEQRGLVTLKHSGRTTVVELSDAGAREQIVQDMPPDAAAPMPDMPRASEEDEDGTRDSASPVAAAADNRGSGEPSPNLADGVALVRAILAEATTPPRWPMYLRQMKQFIRSARPDFDERRYGSLPDLMRACQKDGLLRLERDRQGGLRAFSGPGTFKPAPVPHGWAALAAESEGGGESEAESESTSETQPRHEAESQPQLEAQGPSADPQADEDAQPQFPEVQQEAAAGESEDEDDQLAMFGKVSPLDPEPKAKRPSRARKTGGITDVPRGGVKPRRSPVARGRTADPGLPSRAPRRRPVKK